jgi:hypothetical protein
MTEVLGTFLMVVSFLAVIGLLVSTGPHDWDGPFP